LVFGWDFSHPVIPTLIEFTAASVLIWAGAWKMAQPLTIRGTMRELGLPEPLAVALAPIELGTGLALMLVPGARETVILVLAVAGLFAAAGALAIIRKVRVDCACFGPEWVAQLGWRQILLFPVWAAVAAVSVTNDGSLSIEDRSELVSGWVTMLSAFAAALLLVRGREHRTLRRLRELAQP
jgi:hypothetical protein